MEGYEVKFKVYANSQAEADALSEAVREIVRRNAQRGVAVSADKLVSILKKWGDSSLVTNYFIN